MSSLRTLALAAVAATGAAIVAPAVAAPSGGAPDYLFQLPERQWILGGRLTEAGSRCGRELCEAGYRTGDLVLSVRRANSTVEAVAGMRGCPAVSQRTLAGSQLETLSPSDQYVQIQRAVLAAARTARSQCGSPVSDLIDTGALVNVAPGMAPRT